MAVITKKCTPFQLCASECIERVSEILGHFNVITKIITSIDVEVFVPKDCADSVPKLFLGQYA